MKPILLTIILLLNLMPKLFAQDFVFSPLTVSQGLSDNQIRYIIQLPDGRMVFKTSGNLNIFDGSRFTYIHDKSKQGYALKSYDGFYRIYQSGDSILWIKDHHKLMRVDLYEGKYQSNLNRYFETAGFNGPIDDFFLDSDSRMWLLNNQKLQSKNHQYSIDLNHNVGLLQDVSNERDDLFLFYSTGEVICYNLKAKRQQFKLAAYPAAQQSKFQSTSLVVKAKNGFYQLRNGSNGGCFFFDTRKRDWKKVLETPYHLNTLVVDWDGKATISCANGIWIVDVKHNNSQYIPVIEQEDGTKLNTEISTLLYDKQGGLWLGTANQGLLYHHPHRYLFNTVKKSSFPGSTFKEVMVQSFAEDDLSNIYVKTQSGVYLYKPGVGNEDSLRPLPPKLIPSGVLKGLKTEVLNLPGNQTAKFKDSKGWIWTGTTDGLSVLNPVTGKEQFFYTQNGLSNNFIQSIFEDSRKNIWIATSYGINRVQLSKAAKDVTFINYDASTGALEGEYLRNAVFESKNGTLYFGGVNGFSVLNQNIAQNDKSPFKPVFTDFLVHGKKIDVEGDNNILDKTVPYTSGLVLLYDQNFLTFRFSALNYQNPAQTYYRYKLIGIDQEWRENRSAQGNDFSGRDGVLTIAYTNLPPGKYELQVMASTTNLEWPGEITTINLTINPPWWRTTVAYFCYFGLMVVAIWLSIRFYLRNARKNAERNRREDLLLLRIRSLIDQQNLLSGKLEFANPSSPPRTEIPQYTENMNPMEATFLKKAMLLVENNLNVSDYSVEQLSSDLNMDRTGLYRKLITLLDKSPSLFIRNIRLEKAAELLLEGTLNISEIADRVGFSSSSYLSKCFQERYGCKPSEYAQNAKKST